MYFVADHLTATKTVCQKALWLQHIYWIFFLYQNTHTNNIYLPCLFFELACTMHTHISQVTNKSTKLLKVMRLQEQVSNYYISCGKYEYTIIYSVNINTFTSTELFDFKHSSRIDQSFLSFICFVNMKPVYVTESNTENAVDLSICLQIEKEHHTISHRLAYIYSCSITQQTLQISWLIIAGYKFCSVASIFEMCQT